jgi:hypothetical protein
LPEALRGKEVRNPVEEAADYATGDSQQAGWLG